MDKVSARFTLHVDVFDPQALWDHAHQIGQKENAFSDHEGAIDMLGPRDEPDVTECLRMIFDPGESPPGVQINDSSAEIEVAF